MHTFMFTYAHSHICSYTPSPPHSPPPPHTLTGLILTDVQASPLGSATSSSSFVHPQFAQLGEHPRQSFIYTPPESGRQPSGPPPHLRPREQDRRPGENGGVPRGVGQPSAEGPKMVRRECRMSKGVREERVCVSKSVFGECEC